MFKPKPSCCKPAEGCFVNCDSPNNVFPPGLLSHRQTKDPAVAILALVPRQLETNAQLMEAEISSSQKPSVCPQLPEPPIAQGLSYPEKGNMLRQLAPRGGFSCVVIAMSP